MPQDAFTIRHITIELKNLLVGGKISRIVQPTKDTLLFIIYTRKGNIKLETCLAAQDTRISVTTNETTPPDVAPNFCMLLRKHLQNAEIFDIVQQNFERVVYFDLKCVSDFSTSIMRLYFEIMGKYSNAILCENQVIVGALKTSALDDNAKRVLFGGVKYIPPEPQNKIEPDNITELEKLLNRSSSDLAKTISDNIKGLAYSTALDIVATYGDHITAHDIYEYVCSNKTTPCITYNNGEIDDFKVRATTTNKKVFDSLLVAQEEYYSYITSKRLYKEKLIKLKSIVDAAIKKVEKRIGTINDKLFECNNLESLKLKGELITANIYALEKGQSEFFAVNYYDPDCNKIKIELDKTLPPAQNAQKYYKKYAKLKRTKESILPQLEECNNKLDYLNSIKSHLNSAESIIDLTEIEDELASLELLKITQSKRKKNTTTPFRCYNYDGFKIVVGRNNIQNERLTKGLTQDDIWLHTQKYHSSHVGIICNGKKPDNNVLIFAAELCAYYSDARGGNKIPVDYALKKFVKKPPKTGFGFVVYTDYSTILVNPDKHEQYCIE